MAYLPSLWAMQIKFDPIRRWYRRLVLADEYEVWLLTWLPEQRTGFHDHGPSAGAFVVALGTLQEVTARAGHPVPRTRTLTGGAVRSFGPAYIHDVRNDSADLAVSVHAYSPPLTSMRSSTSTPAGRSAPWARSERGSRPGTVSR